MQILQYNFYAVPFITLAPFVIFSLKTQHNLFKASLLRTQTYKMKLVLTFMLSEKLEKELKEGSIAWVTAIKLLDMVAGISNSRVNFLLFFFLF